MKKSLLLSLAFLACYLPANTQLSFGIKGGINNAWHSEVTDASKMQGLSTSIQIYKRLGKLLEIGVEPGFVQRGTAGNYGEQNYYPYYICCFGDCNYPDLEMMDNPYQGLKASYIQAPVMLRANLPLAKGRFALFSKLGGGPSWLTSGYYGTFVYDETLFGQRPDIKALNFSEDNETATKRWDWGLYGGVGFGCQLGFGMLSFEVEHYRGMSEVSEDRTDKNRSISYSLGYSINL